MNADLTQQKAEEHLSNSELATLRGMAEVDPADALKTFSALPEPLKEELRVAMKQWPIAIRKALMQAVQSSDAITFLERCLQQEIPLKGITLHRPWGHAIAFLGKDIENRRTWQCPLKIGDWVAIHSGKTIDRDGVDFIFQNTGVAVDGDLPGIVAIARFAGNRQPSESGRSIWHREGQIGWHFDQVIPILPIVEHRGQTSLWNVETRAVETILNVLIGTRQKSGVGKSTVVIVRGQIRIIQRDSSSKRLPNACHRNFEKTGYVLKLEGAENGKPYRPSHGTERDIFTAAWCDRCSKYDGCEIFMNVMCGEQPDEWYYWRKSPCCSAFESKPESTATTTNNRENIQRLKKHLGHGGRSPKPFAG